MTANPKATASLAGHGKAIRQHDGNALVSPETGLAMMYANVAVGDWYVAGRLSGADLLKCLRSPHPSRDFPFLGSALDSHGRISVFAHGGAREVLAWLKQIEFL